MSNDFKYKTIQQNIEQRQNEIALYEINIFNYEAALEAADHDDADTQPFLQQLSVLIGTERAEKKKVELILAALQKQLATLEPPVIQA